MSIRQSRIRERSWCILEYTRFIGRDVHAATIAVAVAEAGRRPASFEGSLPATPEAVRQWVRRQPDVATIVVCYESGPTGFETARLLTELGVACQVIAPGLVPTKPTDRVKTDRRERSSWRKPCGRAP